MTCTHTRTKVNSYLDDNWFADVLTEEDRREIPLRVEVVLFGDGTDHLTFAFHVEVWVSS